ncbi:MAG: hypothetical protein ACYC4N_31175 [Pirellulaceae bacterium]
MLVGAVYGWHRYNYPYGFSHCCLKQIGLALHNYAEQHDGRFPAGGGCPEASLSLLYRGDYGINGCTLCGKTKSPEAAQEILERGELLGPDTCDWHYVEGLTLSDDYRLALVWDKVGLGHNGQRLPHGGHSVCRRDGSEEVIPASEWQQFLDEQAQLMTNRTEAAKKGLPQLTAKVRLPSGEIVDHYDASYSLHESYTSASGNGGSGSSSGPKLDASVLGWRRLQDGFTYTFVLSLGSWKSKPVEVRVSRGIAVPDAVVFEMNEDPYNQPPNPTEIIPVR